MDGDLTRRFIVPMQLHTSKKVQCLTYCYMATLQIYLFFDPIDVRAGV